MNSNRFLNYIVIFLVALGAVLIIEKVIFLSPLQALKEVTEKGRYLSLPLGILIKASQYLHNKFKAMENIKEIALANRNNDESLKQQINFVREDFIAFREEYTNGSLDLDRRMIRLEARSELTTKLERHERLISELVDRINRTV